MKNKNRKNTAKIDEKNSSDNKTGQNSIILTNDTPLIINLLFHFLFNYLHFNSIRMILWYCKSQKIVLLQRFLDDFDFIFLFAFFFFFFLFYLSINRIEHINRAIIIIAVFFL